MALCCRASPAHIIEYLPPAASFPATDIRLMHVLGSRYWADPSVRKGGPAQEFFDVAGPGNFNDPDELYVGDGSLTHAEEQAVMALWCIMTGPLLVGIGKPCRRLVLIIASFD